MSASPPGLRSITFGHTNSLVLRRHFGIRSGSVYRLLGARFFQLVPGFGDTETARPNTAFTYRLTYQNFRAAAQAQIGGYDWGNGTQGMYQGQLGADFGPLSLDGIVSWAKDAVSLSSFMLFFKPARLHWRPVDFIERGEAFGTIVRFYTYGPSNQAADPMIES